MIIIGSMIMMYVTSFGVNVLIGSIVQDLQTSVAKVQFVIVSASLIAGSLMVTAGKMGDKFGKKKIFMIGVLIYTIGLTAVVMSPNIEIFSLAWGLIWPSGMVLVIPTSIAIIATIYEGKQRVSAYGIYGAVMAAVAALAPVIVGALANAVNWRVALSISPIVGVITLLASAKLPDMGKDKSVKIDFLSVILSVASFGLFLITTTKAGEYGWLTEKRPFMIGEQAISFGGLSAVPIGYLISAIFMAVFIARGIQLQKKGQTPLLGVAILKNRVFTLGTMIGSLLFLVTAGALFGLSVFLQAGAKFDPLSVALTMLPYSASYAIISFATPGLSTKILPKYIVIAGSAITVGALWWIRESVGVTMQPMDIIAHMIVLGIGMGAVSAQITAVTMSRVSQEENGEASGLSETLKEIIGQGFAVALAGSVLFGAVYSSMASSYEEAESVALSDAERQEIIVELENTFQEITASEEEAWVGKLPEKTRDSYPQIVTDAAEDGIRSVIDAMNICMLLGLLCAILLPKRAGAES